LIHCADLKGERRGGSELDVVGQPQDGIWQEDGFPVPEIDGH